MYIYCICLMNQSLSCTVVLLNVWRDRKQSTEIFLCLCWTYFKETFHINTACQLTTDHTVLPFRFLCLYSCRIYICQ